MAYGLNALDSPKFLLGMTATVRLGAAEIAVDDLDGFLQAAGRFDLPNLAKAARAEPLQESISWDRFGLRLNY